MRRPSCSQVEASIAAYAADELSTDERAAIAVHLDVCESCRDLADVWRALPRVAREAELEPLSPSAERRLLRADVGASPAPPAKISRWRAALGLGLAAAVALALGVVLWLSRPGDGAPDGVAAGDRGAQAGPAMSSSAPGFRAQTRLALADGGARVFDIGLGARLVAGDMARLRLDPCTGNPSTVRASLAAGYAAVEIAPLWRGTELVVETPAGIVTAREAVFSLEVASTDTAWVRVIAGQVYVLPKALGGPAEPVAAGQQAILGRGPASAASPDDLTGDLAFLDAAAPRATLGRDTEKTAAQPTFESGLAGAALPLEDLLRQAREFRQDRDFERAAASYKRLIRMYPASATARSSLVSLGQMELGSMGRAEAALGHFEAYLAAEPAGVLAEEARAGRARAHARLGSSKMLIRSASEYLRAHPDGRAASEMLRRRADAHRQTGRCVDAIRDYRRVLDRWPGSTEAELAAKGLDACAGAP